MKTTIEIPDYYNRNNIVRIRVTPEQLDEQGRCLYGCTHVGKLTEGQLTKLRRKLPNGPAGVQVTKTDRYTGRDTEAEVYFNA